MFWLVHLVGDNQHRHPLLKLYERSNMLGKLVLLKLESFPSFESRFGQCRRIDKISRLELVELHTHDNTFRPPDNYQLKDKVGFYACATRELYLLLTLHHTKDQANDKPQHHLHQYSQDFQGDHDRLGQEGGCANHRCF